MGRPFGRDADNLPVARLRALLRVLPAGDVDLVVAGSPRAVAAVRWPERAKVTTVGWQQADAVLARAYRPGRDPLILASGDGDFVHLARGHPGPVLIVSNQAPVRLRECGTVVDPVTDGLGSLRDRLDAITG